MLIYFWNYATSIGRFTMALCSGVSGMWYQSRWCPCHADRECSLTAVKRTHQNFLKLSSSAKCLSKLQIHHSLHPFWRCLVDGFFLRCQSVVTVWFGCRSFSCLRSWWASYSGWSAPWNCHWWSRSGGATFRILGNPLPNLATLLGAKFKAGHGIGSWDIFSFMFHFFLQLPDLVFLLELRYYFDLQANWQSHCLRRPACHASWHGDNSGERENMRNLIMCEGKRQTWQTQWRDFNAILNCSSFAFCFSFVPPDLLSNIVHWCISGMVFVKFVNVIFRSGPLPISCAGDQQPESPRSSCHLNALLTSHYCQDWRWLLRDPVTAQGVAREHLPCFHELTHLTQERTSGCINLW